MTTRGLLILLCHDFPQVGTWLIIKKEEVSDPDPFNIQIPKTEWKKALTKYGHDKAASGEQSESESEEEDQSDDDEGGLVDEDEGGAGARIVDGEMSEDEDSGGETEMDIEQVEQEEEQNEVRWISLHLFCLTASEK